MAEARLEAIADGNLAGAIALLKPIVAQATGSLKAQAADDLGSDLDGLGRVNEARQAYLQALQADPEDGRAARHLVLLGGLQGAPLATSSTRIDAPSGAGLAANWQALLPDDQRSAFDAQVEGFARRQAAQDLLAEGRRLWQGRDYDRSLSIFDELVTQFPGELKTADLLDIGDRAEQQDRPSLAAIAFQAEARREDADHAPWALYQLGWALMQEGEMNEARVAFARVVRAGARARDPKGRPLATQAEQHLRECRGLTSWEAYLAVRSLYQQGLHDQYSEHDPAKAEIAFRRIVNEFPNSNYDGLALVQLASIAHFDLRQDQAALQDIDEVLENHRANDIWPDGMRAGAWALYYQGRIREEMGDRAGASAAYRALLQQFPGIRDHDGKLFGRKAEIRLKALGATP